MCRVPKDRGRNFPEIMHGFRGIEGAWLLSHLLPPQAAVMTSMFRHYY